MLRLTLSGTARAAARDVLVDWAPTLSLVPVVLSAMLVLRPAAPPWAQLLSGCIAGLAHGLIHFWRVRLIESRARLSERLRISGAIGALDTSPSIRFRRAEPGEGAPPSDPADVERRVNDALWKERRLALLDAKEACWPGEGK